MTIDSNLTISFSSILEEKAFLFAEEAVRLRYNLKSQREYHVADQFFRSATSVGANIAEANEAESRSDFIHKLKIASKELNESFFWMNLLKRAEIPIDLNEALSRAFVVKKILSKSISTATKNKYTQT